MLFVETTTVRRIKESKLDNEVVFVFTVSFLFCLFFFCHIKER